MKNKLILGISAALPFVLTSCGGIGKLNREVFATKDFETVNKIYSNMMDKQFSNKDKRTGVRLKEFVKNGVMTYKYKFLGKGTMRYQDLSLHKVDANLSAGFILSWDLDKEILKVEGEDETHYFTKSGDKYYQCVDCVTNNKQQHKKVQITTVNNDAEFEDYIAYTIDFYTAFWCPLAFSFAPGITGNYYVSIWDYDNELQPIPFRYTVADLFTNDTYNIIKTHKDNGYNLTATYGSNDDNTACAAIKGKGNLKLVHGTDQRGIGDFDIDLFASYKNNFVSQVELAFKGDRHEVETKYTNYKIHYEYNVLQDLKPSSYTADNIDVTKYDDYQA